MACERSCASRPAQCLGGSSRSAGGDGTLRVGGLTLTEITILQPGDQVGTTGGPIGLLFESAPDGEVRRSRPDALALVDLIGDFDDIKMRAHALAERLLAEEPKLRDIAQLRIFDEVVIRELQHAFHVLHFRRRLSTLGVRRCRFQSASRFSQALVDLRARNHLDIDVAVPHIRQRSSAVTAIANSLRRMRRARFSGARLREEMSAAMDRLDPFHRCAVLNARRSHKRGGVWFYTTAYTYTKIGLLYEPYFPSGFEFLVENPATGGRPLRERRRSFVDLYGYASPKDAPLKGEVADAIAVLTTHLSSIGLNGDDELARTILMEGPFLRTFFERLLPAGLFQTTMFERWMEQARPESVVVGNPVFEGYALNAARRQGVPTILLQHGILGDFCQFVDPPVDHYIVRGEFWKAFLSPAARGRADVLNPQGVARTCRTRAETDTLVFVSAPLALQPFFDERELDQILAAILDVACETRRKLVVRVHPLEQVSYYRTRVEAVSARLPTAPIVSYSQGPGLCALLGRAAIAITFNSTVFLDCIQMGVPIVSFAWHDFSFRRQIEPWGVFHFARDLAHLRSLIREAVAGRLTVYEQSIEEFIAQTTDDALRASLASFVRRPGRA